jgi:hypothetical protein
VVNFSDLINESGIWFAKKKEHVFQGPHTRLFIHRIGWRTVTLMLELPLFVQQDSVPQYLRCWAMFVTFMTNKVPYSCIWFVGFYLLTFTDLFLHWFFYNGTSVGRYQNGITTCAMPLWLPCTTCMSTYKLFEKYPWQLYLFTNTGAQHYFHTSWCTVG